MKLRFNFNVLCLIKLKMRTFVTLKKHSSDDLS